jgi:hypothetical protein
VWATSNGPRIEDFGITEGDLESAPGLFVAGHRREILVLAYLVAAAALFLVMLEIGSSWTAAVFFTVIAMAACSVIVVPLIVAILCAGERAEERWLCRRVPTLRACLAYQRALAAHHRRLSHVSIPRPSTPDDWASLRLEKYVAEVGRLLERTRPAVVVSCNRGLTGIDFTLEYPDRRVVLRCEADPKVIAPSVGRELAAALVDCEADTAVIVAVTAPDPVLEAYIADRPIVIVRPWDLNDALAGLGSFVHD